MGKEYFEKDIDDRIDELDNFDDIQCIGLLTLSSYTSPARAQMLSQHLVQSHVPNKPDIPKVGTGHENVFGEYSQNAKCTTDKKLEVKAKIDKFPGYVYTLIVYDSKRDLYDIIQRQEAKALGDAHGYIYNNEVIDSFSPGDTIPKNTVLYRSPSIDEYGNFGYGKNAKVVYTISQQTIEDAIGVREGFAKELAITKVDTCTIPLNDNDIPLNLFGNKKKYKSFPDIGSYMKKSILCGIRRKDKMYDQTMLKNSNLRKIYNNDTVYQFMGDWKVVDIDMWTNKTLDDIPDTPAYEQVKEYYSAIDRYWRTVYNELSKIINKKHVKYSDKLSRLYAKARDFLDPSCKYSYDERMFSNMVIEFKLAISDDLHQGCKLCGRFGNKSVISTIIPDSEMGVTEDGVVPDIRVDALGVLGRLNSGQCIEQELNWISDKVVSDMRAMILPDDPDSQSVYDKQIEYLIDYIREVNADEADELQEYLNDKSRKERNKFIKEILETGDIYIRQSPVNSVTGDTLKVLYDKYGMKKSKIYYKNRFGFKYPAIREVIVADEYFLRLKQEPYTKASMRSSALIGPTSFLPIKSLKNKKHKSIFQDQANRMGEQELVVLALSNDSDALDYFYRSNSSSVSGRRNTTLYEQNPENGFVIDMQSNRSRVIDQNNAILNGMGLEMVMDFYDDEDDMKDQEAIDKSYDPGIDIDDVPSYISDMDYSNKKKIL